MKAESTAANGDAWRPLKVFLTVDVELWPRSWDGYRQQFSDCFNRYVFGRTPTGTVGLPFQLELANDYGLRFVFFVESLFACEFGIDPLVDIVHTIQEAGQEVQLHAHPEWVAHAPAPIIDARGRFLFNDFSEDEQFHLLEAGLANILEGGVQNVRAFRAGSFAANAETLAAVRRVGIPFDSSFKLSALATGGPADRVLARDVREYPLTTYGDWPGRRRDLQLAACSYRELEYVLREAHARRWNSVVILSHSAELLNGDRSRPDRIVVRRFERLCRLLAESREFQTSWFADEESADVSLSPVEPIKSAAWRTGLRVIEQVKGRLLG